MWRGLSSSRSLTTNTCCLCSRSCSLNRDTRRTLTMTGISYSKRWWSNNRRRKATRNITAMDITLMDTNRQEEVWRRVAQWEMEKINTHNSCKSTNLPSSRNRNPKSPRSEELNLKEERHQTHRQVIRNFLKCQNLSWSILDKEKSLLWQV